MKVTLKNYLPSNINTKSAYSASTLDTKFDIKSKTKQDLKHDIPCYVNPNQGDLDTSILPDFQSTPIRHTQ